MSGRQVGRYHDSIGVSTYLRFELAGLSCYQHGRVNMFPVKVIADPT